MDKRRMPVSRNFSDRTAEWGDDIGEAYQQRVPFRPGVANYMVAGQSPREYAMRKVLQRQLDLDYFLQMMQMQTEPVQEISPREYFRNYFNPETMPLRRVR